VHSSGPFILDLVMTRWGGCLRWLAFAVLAGWIGLRVPPLAFVAGVLVGALFARQHWLWRLMRISRCFLRFSGSGVVLYADPRCVSRIYLPELAEVLRSNMEEFATWFGFSLRRRPIVFLCESPRDVSRWFGRSCAGLAFARADIIMVAADRNLPQTVRHEIVHLFADRWNHCPLPLLSEGLATWLQGEFRGSTMDIVSRGSLSRRSAPITELLSPEKFSWLGDQHEHYALAGSFTGFLLRHYGREPYRRFFQRPCARLANVARFEAAFQKCFGESLVDAQHLWKVEALVLPVLKRRLEREFRD
jgi:hypothetical protein